MFNKEFKYPGRYKLQNNDTDAASIRGCVFLYILYYLCCCIHAHPTRTPGVIPQLSTGRRCPPPALPTCVFMWPPWRGGVIMWQFRCYSVTKKVSMITVRISPPPRSPSVSPPTQRSSASDNQMTFVTDVPPKRGTELTNNPFIWGA